MGIVRIEGATLATVPDDQMVDRVRLALRQSDPITALEPVEAVGPAWLSYLDLADFVPIGGDVERLPVDHPAVKDLIARVDQADADEAGLDGIASDAFVVRDADEVIPTSPPTDGGEGDWHGWVLGDEVHPYRPGRSSYMTDALRRLRVGASPGKIRKVPCRGQNGHRFELDRSRNSLPTAASQWRVDVGWRPRHERKT
ncbi:hypothetical protein [Micromonospora kangleipakensis]|uniref:hypothetical protein n=1 Tax=Micromonospora kangleipakensis TaxID=1077942 RepID=UPI00102A93EC|nr:hypothetical protein [Micromonospora kangleipakensis]